MAKKDDVYIALIKFVKERTAETGLLTMDECQAFLADNYSNLNETFRNRLIGEVTLPFRFPQRQGPQNSRELGAESYFRLLEHTELEEARASSLKALRVAIGAIVISIAMALIQITVPDDPIVVQLPHAHSY